MLLRSRLGCSLLVAAAGLAQPCVAQAEVPLIAVASVDGGAGSNVGNGTGIAKRRDVLSADTQGAAITSLRARWRAGVRAAWPRRLAKARLVGQVQITQVNDPASPTSYDDIAQDPKVTSWNLWLRPGQAGKTRSLWVRGADTDLRVRATLGSRPSLRFDRLPERTVMVGFHTSGRLGVGLLRLAGPCRDPWDPGVRVDVRAEFTAGKPRTVRAQDESGCAA